MKKRYLNVVECIIEYQSKLLLIQRPSGVHAEGLLAFPGGAVEESDEGDHEDILRSAVKREIFEEVGLTLLDPLSYVTTSYFSIENGPPVIDTIFYCKLEKTNPTVTPSPREVPFYFWMTREEIRAANNSPPWIKHYIDMHESNLFR